MPHVGWVFVERLPVRGPKSRQSVKDANQSTRPASTRARRGTGSPLADRPLPVPSAPPPGPAPTAKAKVKRAAAETAAVVAAAAATVDNGAQQASRESVNGLLPFLDFVEHHPIGTGCTVVVESYASHGAYARSGDVLVYVPLRLMGDPPPRSARAALKIGEAVAVVIVGYVPERRSIDAALVSAGDVAARAQPPAAVEATEPPRDRAAAVARRRKRRRRRNRHLVEPAVSAASRRRRTSKAKVEADAGAPRLPAQPESPAAVPPPIATPATTKRTRRKTEPEAPAAVDAGAAAAGAEANRSANAPPRRSTRAEATAPSPSPEPVKPVKPPPRREPRRRRALPSRPSSPSRPKQAEAGPTRREASRQAQGEGRQRRLMRLVTWNVNSLRVRQERIEGWLAEVEPDVVCMQETKIADDAFPALSFKALGYESAHFGQGQWNGVAILSRVGLEDVVANFAAGIEPDPDARIITATCGGVRSSSCYVPNGRALDDDHYTYKLSWLDRLQAHLDRDTATERGRRRGRRLQHRADRRRRLRPAASSSGRRTSASPSAPASATLIDWGLDRSVPPAASRRGVGVLVVGLPRRRLPPGTRPAHRPRARLGVDRRSRRSGRDRPQRPQGRQAERSRARRRRPHELTGPPCERGGDPRETAVAT